MHPWAANRGVDGHPEGVVRSCMSTQHTAEIPFRTLASGHGSVNSGGGLYFCRSEQIWASKWVVLQGNRRPEPPLPDVDWATDMVVLLVCGTRSSGGYGVTIESIVGDGGWVEVRAVERRPGRGAFTTAALTNPYHAVTVGADDRAERLLLRIEYHNYDS
jgi:protease stability complex PrcB-like protein